MVGDLDRTLRDGLHHRYRVLRARRARAQHPGAGHAPTNRRRNPARQDRVRALRDGPVGSRLLRSRPPARRRGPRPARRPTEVDRCGRGRIGRYLRPRRHVRDPAASRRATSGREQVNRNFSQTITVRCDNPEILIEMLVEWRLRQATSDIMGYMGTRLMADREVPGQYVFIADFGVIDPDVSAADEALRNNERPETKAWAARLLDVVEGEPEYRHFDELYRTDY